MPDMPQCPGCTVGCNLALPGCGRGLDFAARFEAGEELPEPRPFGPGPKPGSRDGEKSPARGSAPKTAGSPTGSAASSSARGGRPGPNPAEFLSVLLTRIVPEKLGGIEGIAADDATSVLQWVARMEGVMARSVMPARIRSVDKNTLDIVIATLVEEGKLVPTEIGGRVFFEITEAGRAQADAFEAAHTQALEQAFSALTEDEMHQMIALGKKVMGPVR